MRGRKKMWYKINIETEAEFLWGCCLLCFTLVKLLVTRSELSLWLSARLAISCCENLLLKPDNFRNNFHPWAVECPSNYYSLYYNFQSQINVSGVIGDLLSVQPDDGGFSRSERVSSSAKQACWGRCTRRQLAMMIRWKSFSSENSLELNAKSMMKQK